METSACPPRGHRRFSDYRSDKKAARYRISGSRPAGLGISKEGESSMATWVTRSFPVQLAPKV